MFSPHIAFGSKGFLCVSMCLNIVKYFRNTEYLKSLTC